MIINKDMEKDDSILIILNSCDELGIAVADKLKGKINCIDTKFQKFGNNEINIAPLESVRQKNVYIIGSGSNMNSNSSINDNIMEMCIIIRACRDASAKSITLICAYFPYCRSDKKDQGRMPITAKLMCDLFKISGVNRLMTFDLHAAQIQGFFDGPFDNLYTGKYLIQSLNEDFDITFDKYITVSPDVGRMKLIQDFANKLNTNYTFLIKVRDHNKISHISHHEIVHNLDFKHKICFLIDDIGDTFGTLNSAAKLLKDRGASKIIAVITHGIFSGKAFDNLYNIDKIYVTNTLSQNNNILKSDKIKIIDISELCSQAITCCINGTSVSSLFD